MDFSGDSLIGSPNLTSSREIVIQGSPADVWPWLVQIGQERGGFYSYSFLENLIGCKIKNAQEIHPEWQQLVVGDTISLHPKAPRLHVAMVKKDRHLVLSQKKPVLWTWGFYLTPDSDHACRLTVRTRAKVENWMALNLARPFVYVGHGIMERKMLKGIRQRVEKSRNRT